MRLYAFVVFVVAPVVELVGIVAVWQLVGPWTLVLLAAAFLLGIWILRWLRWQVALSLVQVRRATAAGESSQGRRARDAGSGADKALIALAAILLILPGFVGDVVALLLLLPPVRALLRRYVSVWFTQRVATVSGPAGFSVWTRRTGEGVMPGEVIPGEVVQGDVVREQPWDDDEPPPAIGRGS